MLDVIEVVVQMVLNIALPAWLVHWDEKRLSKLELSRAWPQASFWIAVVAFGPLSLPVHFLRTRRSLLGFLLGVLGLVAVVAAQVLASALLGSLKPE